MALYGQRLGMSPLSRRAERWQGRSGKSYELVSEDMDRFALADDALHLIAKGRLVLWVGSQADLVADPASRARFRLALTCADRVYRLDDHTAEGERLALVFDLEGAEPLAALNAA
jgi:hypothetical protein